MPEGTYYARKKLEKTEPEEETVELLSTEETITESTQTEDYNPALKLIVKDGKAVLANAIYGHDYEFKEIEAPKSYQLSDALYSYKAVSPEGKDIVVYIFENKRIEVPNTGINW